MYTYDAFVIKEYRDGLSIGEIAAKLNTYPNKVKRILVKAGEKLRTKSEAQSNFLKKNPDKHPKRKKENG